MVIGDAEHVRDGAHVHLHVARHADHHAAPVVVAEVAVKGSCHLRVATPAV